MKTILFNERVYTPSKIVCVGKNFSDHAKEMGTEDLPSEPVVFIKPNSSLVFFQTETIHSGVKNKLPEAPSDGDPKFANQVFVPETWGLLHHEIELCFLVGKTCSRVSDLDAKSFIIGYGVGMDLTLRDRQTEAKKNGNPWAISKGFDNSAIIGSFVGAESGLEPLEMCMSLKVNGKIFQKGNAREMIFSPSYILSYVSKFMTLEEGDTFMCGTPSGVGPLFNGDCVEAKIEMLPSLCFRIVRS